MSIIYDALKKIEQSGSLVVRAKEDKPVDKRRLFLVYALVLVSGVLLAKFSWWGMTEFISRGTKDETRQLSAAVPAAKPKKILPLETVSVLDYRAAPQPDKRETFVLNGIFFSEEEGYALINNQVTKEGDLVDGALVKNISPDTVELDSQGEIIRLFCRK